MVIISYLFIGSRFTVENYLEKYDFNTRVLSLENVKLTTMCHQELLTLVEKVELSNNCLRDVKQFSCMRCVKELYLDDNQLLDVSELSFLPNLELLSIRRNCILLTIIFTLTVFPPFPTNVICFLICWYTLLA